MIMRMQREGGDVGLKYVDAVILDPAKVSDSALLEMEQREQLTENFKVRYNDIDYLLALREAAEHREIDWYDETASTMSREDYRRWSRSRRVRFFAICMRSGIWMSSSTTRISRGNTIVCYARLNGSGTSAGRCRP